MRISWCLHYYHKILSVAFVVHSQCYTYTLLLLLVMLKKADEPVFEIWNYIAGWFLPAFVYLNKSGLTLSNSFRLTLIYLLKCNWPILSNNQREIILSSMLNKNHCLHSIIYYYWFLFVFDERLITIAFIAIEYT